jgi:hypothetical protein
MEVWVEGHLAQVAALRQRPGPHGEDSALKPNFVRVWLDQKKQP